MNIDIIEGVVHVDGVPHTPEEYDAIIRQIGDTETIEQNLAKNAQAMAYEALADALELADLYPAPTPEETALIDLQVSASLASFRGLAQKTPEIVALAAAVVSWRSEL